MIREELRHDDPLREAFNTMTTSGRLETNACRFISKSECNHVGDEDGIMGCVAFLLGRLLKKFDRLERR